MSQVRLAVRLRRRVLQVRNEHERKIRSGAVFGPDQDDSGARS
jgi:hypothetical protein